MKVDSIEHTKYYHLVSLHRSKPFQIFDLEFSKRFHVNRMRKAGIWVILSDEDNIQSLYVWIHQYKQAVKYLKKVYNYRITPEEFKNVAA